MKGLTSRQKAVFEYVKRYLKENGFWPSIREIQKEFQFKSTNAVMGHLRALEHKGVISRRPGQARAFKIESMDDGPTGNPDNMITLPVFGTTAAGYSDHVESSSEISNLQLNVRTLGVRDRQKAFAFRVSGNSMIRAGIHDGDIVIIENAQPENNNIVAALIDGETTLKRFIKEPGNDAYLKAEDSNYSDFLPATDLKIQGIARSVVRNL